MEPLMIGPLTDDTQVLFSMKCPVCGGVNLSLDRDCKHCGVFIEACETSVASQGHGKRKIKARELAQDIRANMSYEAIRLKYMLTESSLDDLFERLVLETTLVNFWEIPLKMTSDRLLRTAPQPVSRSFVSKEKAMSPKRPDNAEYKRTSKGASTIIGFLLGLVLSAVSLVLGPLLCVTGIGAILGIPMIIGAFLFPFIGAVVGYFVVDLRGPCPYCGTTLSSAGRKGFDCTVCKKRIVVNDNRFQRVD